MAPYGEFGVISSEWLGGKENRWSSEKKLRSLHPELRAKVQLVMSRLAARGLKPYLFYAWRSAETQASLTAGGTSWVSFSFHNALDADGQPASLAADIVDADVWWGAKDAAAKAQADRFFAALGEEAKRAGLYWGGDWSGRSYDPAHVQLYPNNMLGQVKAASEAAMSAARSAVTTVTDTAAEYAPTVRRTLPFLAFVPLIAGAGLLAVLFAVARR